MKFYIHIETGQLPMSTYIRIFNGLIMASSLYRKFYVHIETSLMFMCTYISILNGLTMASSLYRKFYVPIDTCLMLMSIYIRYKSPYDIIIIFLCSQRDKSDFYVHIHQDFLVC